MASGFRRFFARLRRGGLTTVERYGIGLRFGRAQFLRRFAIFARFFLTGGLRKYLPNFFMI